MKPAPAPLFLALLLASASLAGAGARAEGMPASAPMAHPTPILRADPGAGLRAITDVMPARARLAEPLPGPTRMANPVAVPDTIRDANPATASPAMPAAALRKEVDQAAPSLAVSAGDSPLDVPASTPRSGLAAAWAMVVSALVGGFALGGSSGGGTLLGGLLILVAAWLLRRSVLGSPLPTLAVRTEPTGWGSTPPPQDDPVPPIAHSARNGAALRLPPGFDLPGFLREARLSFVRLQAANDRADVDDLREFTTPQMYAALADQLEARQGAQQAVEVMALDAQLLDLAVLQDEALASVRFHGSARAGQANPLPFTEVWHVRKSFSDPRSAWLLDGIQQST